MNSRPRPYLALLSVVVLTLILTLLLSSGAPVRALLQASPVSTPPSSAPTLPSPGAEPLPSLQPPTSVPLPPTVGPTPTVQGFLPAPTIVNPNDPQSLPIAQPPVSGGGDPDKPALATPEPAASSTARAVVALVNYLWLLCGGALLIGGAVAILLIWRRGRHA